MVRMFSFQIVITMVTFIASVTTAADLVIEDPALFQEAYVKASNTGREDYFGGSVAISGNTFVVGASGEHSSATGIDGDQSDNSARFSGAAYVFTREGGVSTQQAYIKASNTDPVDSFGERVALSGNTLVVAAVGESSGATGIDGDQSDNSADDAGAVYVFTRTDGVWSQQAYVKASNTDSSDQFGISLALSGDTLVVGATSEDSSATGIDGNQDDNSADNAGAVYVFTRTDGVWSQQSYLKASNTDEGDGFGASVTLEGDSLVVGAGGEDSATIGLNGDQTDNSAEGSGAVYVFTRTAGVWTQQAYLKASNTDAGDSFGSCALSGDTLVVGAWGERSSATGIDGDQSDNSTGEAGAAYVFRQTDGVWSQQAYLKASNTDAQDYFGGSVALEGDTLVVSALGESSSATGFNGDQTDNSAYQAGAGYVFTRKNGVWTQQAYLKAPNTDGHDWFTPGAVSGHTIVASAVMEGSKATGINGDQTDNSLYGAGAAYVFRFDQSEIIFMDGFEAVEVFEWQQLGADIDGEANVDRSGSSVSLSADGSIVAIGAPGNDGSGEGAGHVRIHQWTGSVWQQMGADIDGEASWDGLGRSVSLSADGNRVAIGAASSNRTRVYQWTGSVWQQVGADIDGEASGDGSGWGVSLSADGNRVAIGATGNDGNGDYAGHVRIHQWTGSVWQQMGADIDGEAGGDYSGSSVSLSADGSIVAIGARFNDGNGDSAGHVRIYQWTGSDWQQMGADIDGEAGGEYSGSSVSLSAGGSIVAIGTTYRNRARIYQWSGSDWQQLGDDINGEAGGDFRPWSVSLSADGGWVAIGAGSSNFVRVYQWTGSVWQQMGANIDGEAGDDLFGLSVSLSADGKRVAIGAPTWGFDDSPAGYVRVFTSID